MSFKYDFAISYASERREIAEKIARLLTAKKARVYYDRYFESEMLGKKLSVYFHQKFGVNTRFVIILISKEYPLKDWTNWELSIVRDEAKKRKEEFILPVRIDNTKILGIHDDIGFIDLNKKSVEEAVDILLEKLDKEGLRKTFEGKTEVFDEKYFKDEAKALLSKVNKINAPLSEILPEFYNFLLSIDDKEEIKWVEAELSGKIYETGKDNPEYFKYRGIKGHLSPVKVISPGYYTLDMIIADKKNAMAPFSYIPSVSIFELERILNNSSNFGMITLNEAVVKLLNLDSIKISKLYFYFKNSDIIHIIFNVKQKISGFLINVIKKNFD